MSKEERLSTIERIWESFSRDGIEIPSPAWHRQILEDRTRIADSAGAEWLSVDELETRLSKK